MVRPTEERDFIDVLTATLGEIPAEEIELRQRLSKILADTPFQAPEIRWSESGGDVQATFEHFFGKLSDDELLSVPWRKKMISVWIGRDL